MDPSETQNAMYDPTITDILTEPQHVVLDTLFQMVRICNNDVSHIELGISVYRHPAGIRIRVYAQNSTSGHDLPNPLRTFSFSIWNPELIGNKDSQSALMTTTFADGIPFMTTGRLLQDLICRLLDDPRMGFGNGQDLKVLPNQSITIFRPMGQHVLAHRCVSPARSALMICFHHLGNISRTFQLRDIWTRNILTYLPPFLMISEPANFSILPTEIQLKIVGYLGPKDRLLKAALVCKRWRRLAEDVTLWTETTVLMNLLPSTGLPGILNRFPKLKRLVLYEFTMGYLEDFELPQTGLEMLDMYSVSLRRGRIMGQDSKYTRSESCVQDITRMLCRYPLGNCVTVYHIVLNQYHIRRPRHCFLDTFSVTWRNEEFSDIYIQQVLTAISCKYIKMLSLRGIQHDLSYQLVGRCVNLHTLELDLKDFGITPENLLRGVGNIHGLRKLSLNFTRSNDEEELLPIPSSKVFQELFGSPGFPSLEYLSLKSASSVDDKCAKIIACASPRLRVLTLQHTQVTIQGYLNIADRCHHLKTLCIDESLRDEQDSLTDEELSAILLQRGCLWISHYNGTYSSTYSA